MARDAGWMGKVEGLRKSTINQAPFRRVSPLRSCVTGPEEISLNGVSQPPAVNLVAAVVDRLLQSLDADLANAGQTGKLRLQSLDVCLT